MTPEPSPDQQNAGIKRTQFLLTNLIILSIVILALILLIAGYPILSHSGEKATSINIPTLRPTITPSLTPTISLTPTPSRTLRFTVTPSLTPTRTKTGTPTVMPTPTGPIPLIAARPVTGKEYQLIKWNADQADQLIQYLNAYPNSLLKQGLEQDLRIYTAAFSYAIIAQREALVRYPDATQANAWQWGLAYNLARTGDSQAGQAYANLIRQALNQDEVQPDNLESWFHTKEPRLSLYVDDLGETPGVLNSRILEVRGAGSAFIWLSETTSIYKVEVLTSQFDFIHPPSFNSLVTDLNGDKLLDVAIFDYTPHKSSSADGSLIADPPRVFSLAEAPARQLFFRSSESDFEVGVDFTNYWGISQSSAGENHLTFHTTVYPACPITIQREYQWNGEYFQRITILFTAQPPQSNLSLCEPLLDHALHTWGAAAAASILEQLLPGLEKAQSDLDPKFLLQASDTWRYRLGIYRALTGDVSGARQILEEVIQKPTLPDGPWRTLASQFRQNYQKSEDIYRACLESADCPPDQAITYLINTRLKSAKMDGLTFLWQAGITLRASGYFDFDRDGQKERWFTVQYHPFEKLELWILAGSPQGDTALLVGTIDSDKPGFTYLDETQAPPVVLVDNQIPIRLQRDPQTAAPYLTIPDLPRLYPDRFQEAVTSLREALLSGISAADIHEKLLLLQDTPGLLCENTYNCDAYYYFLGLSSEMAGDERGAVDAYLKLWWDYVKSPYTIMARFKLVGGTQGIITTPTVPAVMGTPTGLTPTPTATPTPESAYPIVTETEYNPYPNP